MTSLELFDNPLSFVIFISVLCNLSLNSFWYFKCDCSSLFRQIKSCNQLCSSFVTWTRGFNFQCELKFILCKFFNCWDYPEWSLIILLNSIIHYKEFSIRWADRKSFQRFKITSINAFMKSTIIEHNSTLLSLKCSLTQSYEVIIQYKSQTRVSSEIAFHLDNTID